MSNVVVSIFPSEKQAAPKILAERGTQINGNEHHPKCRSLPCAGDDSRSNASHLIVARNAISQIHFTCAPVQI
jgi:hypothetical protein